MHATGMLSVCAEVYNCGPIILQLFRGACPDEGTFCTLHANLLEPTCPCLYDVTIRLAALVRLIRKGNSQVRLAQLSLKKS